nr:helix-turn-helix transcriptional regulator [Brevibacillus laterosporus]
MQSRNITGKQIRKFRKGLNLTQDELSAKLMVLGINIDRPMVSKIENQTREITDIELKCIAHVLGVTVNCLFDEKGEK